MTIYTSTTSYCGGNTAHTADITEFERMFVAREAEATQAKHYMRLVFNCPELFHTVSISDAKQNRLIWKYCDTLFAFAPI
mmetsp:Transcript_29823/g.63859  ORF Transcript_29823/g.63859 Transcript_29823/m.63859 type:complete len:80 (+) Transcript_29823:412-651(+)